MSVVPRSEEELKTIFVSSCIESVANHLGCPASVMYARMQKIEDIYGNIMTHCIHKVGNMS